MKETPEFVSPRWIFALLIAATLICPSRAQAGGEKLFYSFSFSNGQRPEGGLIQDRKGNFYGTTAEGGFGFGVIYQIARNGHETVLYEFSSMSNGWHPTGDLLLDAAGNFYGVTELGGAGYGTVFKFGADGTFTVLHTFNNRDGSQPFAGLISDEEGNLYGTTSGGGPSGAGAGVAFKLTLDGELTILHEFIGANFNDGWSPVGSLTRDAQGNLYGVTSSGGDPVCNCGTFFKIDPAGVETVLHKFNGIDGYQPHRVALVMDETGNFYGTTYAGGIYDYRGVVFKIAPDGTETVLYNFAGEEDGGHPEVGVIRDSAGNLYGTTTCVNCLGGAEAGHGVVYKLAPDGTYTVLHSFVNDGDGEMPFGRLLRSRRVFYGTTYLGGAYGAGSVFQVKE